MAELNIYMRLAKARLAVQKRCTKKSGYNKFADYHYFTLDDILSPTTDELEKQGLIALFNIKRRKLPFVESERLESVEGLIEEVGLLEITDGTNSITFEIPTAEVAIKGAMLIQNLGGKNSYVKRYLYLNAMELSEESDPIDSSKPDEKQIGKEEKKETSKPATKAQIELMKKMNVLIPDNCTLEQASKLIQEAKKWS